MITITGSRAKDAASTRLDGGNLLSITPDTSPEPTTDAVGLDADSFGGNFIKRTSQDIYPLRASKQYRYE